MAQSKSFSKILILALVLFVPGFLYLLMKNLGHHEYVKLPVYGEKVLSGEMRRVMGREIPDTIFHKLQSVTFTDLGGERVEFLHSDTSISIIHLFYGADSAYAKTMLDQMVTLTDKFQNQSSVQFYSISIDTVDSPQSLKWIESDYSTVSQRPHWHILTEPDVDILTYARKQMLLDAVPDEEHQGKFIVSNQFILVDGKRRIRGFYPVDQSSEIKRLIDEIKVQMVEEVRNNPRIIERQ